MTLARKAFSAMAAVVLCMLELCHGGLAFASDTAASPPDIAAKLLAAEAAQNKAYLKYGRGVRPKLDAEAAKRIAGLAYRMPAVNFDLNPYGDPPWIDLAALGKPGAQGFIDFVSVNPWTGNVWSRRKCKQVSTPSSRKAQDAILKSFTRSEKKHYRRLARLRPGCDT